MNTTACAKNWKLNRFAQRIGKEGLEKDNISVLQINLGRKCNLACAHCHVEASPQRTEEISETVKNQILEMIDRFDQIKTIDLTGGAPEMHHGFREICLAARKKNIEVIVRTNLTIMCIEEYKDLPEFFSENKLHLVASLPCYLEDNVDKMRGSGVFKDSITALQKLNAKGYGKPGSVLEIDLVYNPAIPINTEFSKTPEQGPLEIAYKEYLKEKFNVSFNKLYTITNIPIGRFKKYLEIRKFHEAYLEFLEEIFNKETLPFLMCKNQLSIDYLGNVYDCDFNQMEKVPAYNAQGKALALEDFLTADNLNIIEKIQLRNYCYGCTAGAGSSCGGSLL